VEIGEEIGKNIKRVQRKGRKKEGLQIGREGEGGGGLQ
jgi:hypothetical protein